MRPLFLRAASLAAALVLAQTPVHADYVGAQAGGAGNITYGAFAPTIGGVVTQLTKSVPVDPVTGLAIPLATSTKQPAFGTAGAPSAEVLSVQGVVNGVPQGTDTIVRSTSTDRGGTLTTANTAQTLVPANTARRGLAVQNRNAPAASYSSATSVFMNCLGTASATGATSLEIPAGALYETPGHHSGTGACSFVSGTAGTVVYVREF